MVFYVAIEMRNGLVVVIHAFFKLLIPMIRSRELDSAAAFGLFWACLCGGRGA